MSGIHTLSIDPLALILSPAVYVRLTLPDPPPDEIMRRHIRDLAHSLGPEEKKYVHARAKALGTYAKVLVEELSNH